MTLILVLSLAVPANAASGDFTIENGVLTAYNGPGGDVVIPDGVTAIGDDVFVAAADYLVSLTIPKSVTKIGEAFYFFTTPPEIYYAGSESEWKEILMEGEDVTLLLSSPAYINGQRVDAQVYKIDGSNYFKLRDLGKALNFYVGWTQEQGIFIETNQPYQD